MIKDHFELIIFKMTDHYDILQRNWKFSLKQYFGDSIIYQVGHPNLNQNCNWVILEYGLD